MSAKQTIAKLAESPVIISDEATLEAYVTGDTLSLWLQDAISRDTTDNVKASAKLSQKSSALIDRHRDVRDKLIVTLTWPELRLITSRGGDAHVIQRTPEFKELVAKLHAMIMPEEKPEEVNLGVFHTTFKDFQKLAIDSGLPSTTSRAKAETAALATGKKLGRALMAHGAEEYFVVGDQAELDKLTRLAARFASQREEAVKLAESPVIISQPASVEFVIVLNAEKIRAEVNDYTKSFAPTDRVRVVKPLTPESLARFRELTSDASISCYFSWPDLTTPHLDRAPRHADESAALDLVRAATKILRTTPEFTELVAELNRLTAIDAHSVQRVVNIDSRIVTYDELPEILAELGLSGARNPDKVMRLTAATGRGLIKFHSKVGYDTGPFYIAATPQEEEKFRRHLTRLELSKAESARKLVAGLLESPIVLDSSDSIYVVGEYDFDSHSVGIEIRDADSELVLRNETPVVSKTRQQLNSAALKRVGPDDSGSVVSTTFQFPDEPNRSSSEFMLSYAGANARAEVVSNVLYDLPEFKKLWDESVGVVEQVNVLNAINRVPYNVPLGSKTLVALSDAGLSVTNRIHVAAAAAAKSGAGIHRFKGRNSDNIWVIGTDKDVEKAKRIFAKLSVENDNADDS